MSKIGSLRRRVFRRVISSKDNPEGAKVNKSEVDVLWGAVLVLLVWCLAQDIYVHYYIIPKVNAMAADMANRTLPVFWGP